MTRSFINRRSMMSLMATALVAPMAAASVAPRIVATTRLLADCAERLCGTGVKALLPSQMDAQDDRPSRADAGLLAQADLVLWHGPQTEPGLAPHLSRLARSRPVVALDGAARWPAQVPAHRAEMVTALAATLTTHFPQLAGRITEQTAQLHAEIAALDRRCAARLAMPLRDARLLVTDSPALTAFAAAYGLATTTIPATSAARRALLARMVAQGNLTVFADAHTETAQAFAAMAPGLTCVQITPAPASAGTADLAEQTAAALALHLSAPSGV